MQIVAKVVAVVVVVVVVVVEVGVVVVAVVVALEPCVGVDEKFLLEFGMIGFVAVVDGVSVPNVFGFAELAVTIPLAVG